jgi:Flp pilus assembly pilin Flp
MPLRLLWSDEQGATMVEYSLMVCLIAAAVVVAAAVFGRSVLSLFQLAVSAITSAV